MVVSLFSPRIFTSAVFLVAAGFILVSTSRAQNSTITETEQEIRTYPFDGPNPIPTLTTQPEIYPYFRFDGFSHEVERDCLDKLINDEFKVVRHPPASTDSS